MLTDIQASFLVLALTTSIASLQHTQCFFSATSTTMERPKQSSLNSPDDSKAISTDEDFGTQGTETSFHGLKRVSEMEDGSDVEKDGEEVPTDDCCNDDDYEEYEPVYEDEDYDKMEPREKQEKKRKDPKSDKQRGKEKRKGDCTKRSGKGQDESEDAYI